MNNFKIKIVERESPTKAESGLNDFIDHCNRHDIEILDITSHVTVHTNDCHTYTFVVKCKK